MPGRGAGVRRDEDVGQRFVALLNLAYFGVEFAVGVAPEPLALSLTGLGALAVNLACALMLARYRHHAGSLTRAAFLSARNDVLANVAIIGAGAVTALLWRTAWPDVVVGLGIGLLNADAAREAWGAARAVHREET